MKKIENKDRPILFSADMVRAILDGRKTQTRRIVKPAGKDGGKEYLCESPHKCPYGEPGDRLWVRETFRRSNKWLPDGIEYRASDLLRCFGILSSMEKRCAVNLPRDGKWRSSIHMPRWASRILLEVTDIRIEQLQDISEMDAIAEGVERGEKHLWKNYYTKKYGDWGDFPYKSARKSYASLWRKIHGSESHKSFHENPWVWVVTFKRV